VGPQRKGAIPPRGKVRSRKKTEIVGEKEAGLARVGAKEETLGLAQASKKEGKREEGGTGQSGTLKERLGRQYEERLDGRKREKK